MEKKRRKKRRTRRRKTLSWADLPHDIQVIILRKLNRVDIIRYRATCKNWRIPMDRIFDRPDIPWLCKLSWSKVDQGLLECKLYDPYSRLTFKTRKLVENLKGFERFNYDIQKYGSKLGWLIAGYNQRPNFYLMFMYHPYSKEFIWLPPTKSRPCLATFSGNPGSQDCQVFIFCDFCNASNCYIGSYCLYGNNHWRVEIDFKKEYYICGFEYMNGHIFGLFEGGITGRYSLAHRSWRFLYRLSLGNSNSYLWLTKGEGELLVAVAADQDTRKYSTFYFDWSNTSWVQSDLPETWAIFIAGNLATFASNE